MMSARLRVLMEEKGWSVGDLAKRMEQELSGERFNPVNLSHYKAGRSIPRPRYLMALSRVLGVMPQDLVPPVTGFDEDVPEEDAAAAGSLPVFRIEDLPNGQALLQINQTMPWSQVLRLLDALKGERKDVPD